MDLPITLIGLLFAAVDVLNVVRPRVMTSYRIRSRTGGNIEGQVEPSSIRLLVTRITGGVLFFLGLGLAMGMIEF